MAKTKTIDAASALATFAIVEFRYDVKHGVQHLVHNEAAIEQLAQEAIIRKLSRGAALVMIAEALREWECGE